MEFPSFFNLLIIATILSCSCAYADEEKKEQVIETIEVKEGTVTHQGTNKEWANGIRADPENPNPYFNAATISIDGLESLMNNYFENKKRIEGDQIIAQGKITQELAAQRQIKMENRQYDIMHGEFKMAEHALNTFLTADDDDDHLQSGSAPGKKPAKSGASSGGDPEDEGNGHPPAEDNTEPEAPAEAPAAAAIPDKKAPADDADDEGGAAAGRTIKPKKNKKDGEEKKSKTADEPVQGVTMGPDE